MNPLTLILTLSLGALAVILNGNEASGSTRTTVTLPKSIHQRILFFRKVAPLALFYAIGGETYVDKMKPKSSRKIFELVVLTDHYGMFGGKQVPTGEKLTDHLSPFIENSTKEMVFFLRDWCCRIDFTELGMIKNIDAIRLAMKAKNDKEMLQIFSLK